MSTVIRFPRPIANDAWHIPDWLSPHQQRRLVNAWRIYAVGPLPHRSPMRHIPALNGSNVFVQPLRLDWNWQSSGYSKTVADLDGATVSGFPAWLGHLACAAAAMAYKDPDAGYYYRPDAALINYYRDDARLKMHRDTGARSSAPSCRSASATPARFALATPRAKRRVAFRRSPVCVVD